MQDARLKCMHVLVGYLWPIYFWWFRCFWKFYFVCRPEYVDRGNYSICSVINIKCKMKYYWHNIICTWKNLNNRYYYNLRNWFGSSWIDMKYFKYYYFWPEYQLIIYMHPLNLFTNSKFMTQIWTMSNSKNIVN